MKIRSLVVNFTLYTTGCEIRSFHNLPFWEIVAVKNGSFRVGLCNDPILRSKEYNIEPRNGWRFQMWLIELVTMNNIFIRFSVASKRLCNTLSRSVRRSIITLLFDLVDLLRPIPCIMSYLDSSSHRFIHQNWGNLICYYYINNGLYNETITMCQIQWRFVNFCHSWEGFRHSWECFTGSWEGLSGS